MIKRKNEQAEKTGMWKTRETEIQLASVHLAVRLSVRPSVPFLFYQHYLFKCSFLLQLCSLKIVSFNLGSTFPVDGNEF